MNLISDILKNTVAVTVLSSAIHNAHQQSEEEANKNALLDAANKANQQQEGGDGDMPEIAYTDTMRLDATRVIREWSETDDLGEGEGYGDRLLALLVGTAADSDTDLTEDEVDYAGMVAELVGDYLEDKGIPGDDIDTLISSGDFDNDVAERVHEMLLDKLPQGDDAMNDDASRFVDGGDDDMLDATYRKVVAVRGGRKVKLKKRIAGTVRLTAAQKGAVRKMQRKAFSGGAKIKRAKSMRLRKKLGL